MHSQGRGYTVRKCQYIYIIGNGIDGSIRVMVCQRSNLIEWDDKGLKALKREKNSLIFFNTKLSEKIKQAHNFFILFTLYLCRLYDVWYVFFTKNSLLQKDLWWNKMMRFKIKCTV